MRLSTSTNILFLRPDNSIFPLPAAMEKIAQAGFTMLDLNYYDWVTTPGSPYMTEQWEQWVEDIIKASQRLSLEFEQSHAYFYDFLSPKLSDEQKTHEEAEVLRSLETAHRLKTKVVVVHPASCRNTQYLVRDSKEQNRRYFFDLLEKTKHTQLVFAIENMWELDSSPSRKYCAVPEELVDLVDSINDTRLKICWDFEHADLMKQNQPQIMCMLGNRLAATHVSEQNGFHDLSLLHRMPLFGKIDWEPIMKALHEINYQGCFSYEAHNFLNTLPDSCIETALRLSYLIGEHLMKMQDN